MSYLREEREGLSFIPDPPREGEQVAQRLDHVVVAVPAHDLRAEEGVRGVRVVVLRVEARVDRHARVERACATDRKGGGGGGGLSFVPPTARARTRARADP